MIPYVYNCLLCCALTSIGTHVKSKSAEKIFYLLTVFFVCFMAAVRDSSVGTDVLVYGDNAFNICKRNSLIDVFNSYSKEPLYLLTTWITANFANRYIYYFVLQFLVFAPIYATLLKQQKKDKAWIGVFIYFFWMYSYTFNLMRQCIAVAILIYATKYIFEKRYCLYALFVVLAMGFHSTAIIGIMPLLIYWLFVYQPVEAENESGSVRMYIGTASFSSSFNRFKTRYHALLNILLFTLEVFLVYNADGLITFVSTITGRYEGQVERINSTFSVSLVLVIVLFLILIILYIMTRSENLHREPINQFYLIIIASGIILFFLYGISSQMYRVSLYLTCQFPVYISLLFGKMKKDANYYAFLIIIFVLFIYFYIRTIVGGGWNEVIPYTSKYLGIN